MSRRTIFALVASLLLAGCAGPGQGSPPAPGATREPLEQSFGPAYPAAAPAGRPVRIDNAELSADQRMLTITFVGGKGYLASDPCSTDYEPWLGPRGETLDLAVTQVAHAEQVPLPPNTGCTLEGYGHTYHLALPAPFGGTTVNDLAGGTLLVANPPDAATATLLPAGWSLRRSFQQEPGPPPVWVQVYAPSDIGEMPFEGRGRLVLYQAFGPSGEWSAVRAEKSRERGGVPVDVSMSGQAATVWVDAASGELLLAWTLAGRSLGLIGNAADLTPEGLVKIAEAVTIGGG